MIKELIQFLRYPYHVENQMVMSFNRFFRLLILKFGFAIPFIIVMIFIDADEFDHAFDDDEFTWLFGLYVICIAPLIEEVIFRLPLDLKKSHILWSIALSVLIIRDNWEPFLLVILFLAFLLFTAMIKKHPNLKWVILISSALFGFSHMVNYSDFDYGQYFYLIPVLIGSQALGGLIAAYIRLTYGMKWAILNHASFNGVLILPLLLLEYVISVK
jgi:hypothetical protein